jgi:membrane protease YdiL (CAAX protease family)
MAKWFEFIIGKPYESELKDPATLLFALVGMLAGIVVVWPFIGAWVADTLLRSGFTLWAAVPVELAIVIGALLGAALGKVVDRKAAERTRLLMLRCRQVFFLMVSAVGLVYCLVYLYSDSIIFVVASVSMVLLAFGQTRWRPRPGALRRSSRNAP